MRYGRYTAYLVLLAGTLVFAAGCPSKKTKYPICSKDKDCRDGERCIAKQCMQCGEDSHCKDGQVCRKGACVSKKSECTSDDDCGDGKVCTDNQCVACKSNGECGPGGKCNAGACTRPKKCSKNEDCEDDEDCLQGRCQKPWKSDKPAGVTCPLATVYFGYDQHGVPTEARDGLDKTADCIKSAPKSRGVSLVGHTDPRGTEEYNIALSERRGRAVADYLARLGIDPARLRVIPKGEADSSGTEESSYQQDRRVSFEWR